VRLVQRTFIDVFCFMVQLPFYSKEDRGGVMVLLKLMEDEVRLGLFMGTLWCEKRGFGYLYGKGSTQPL
jgi:hypothetical protein